MGHCVCERGHRCCDGAGACSQSRYCGCRCFVVLLITHIWGSSGRRNRCSCLAWCHVRISVVTGVTTRGIAPRNMLTTMLAGNHHRRSGHRDRMCVATTSWQLWRKKERCRDSSTAVHLHCCPEHRNVVSCHVHASALTQLLPTHEPFHSCQAPGLRRVRNAGAEQCWLNEERVLTTRTLGEQLLAARLWVTLPPDASAALRCLQQQQSRRREQARSARARLLAHCRRYLCHSHRQWLVREVRVQGRVRRGQSRRRRSRQGRCLTASLVLSVPLSQSPGK
jgi:hypothetical protein